MAKFSYQVRDSKGKTSDGDIDAASLEEAGRKLRGEGKFIIHIEPAARADEPEELYSVEEHARRVKRRDVILFTHEMAVMIETGVRLTDALDSIADQAESMHFKAVLRDVARTVRGGANFSRALGKHPRAFPPVMISLIRAAEISGSLSSMLERLSGYMAKEQQITRQARGAMMYPLFMVIMTAGVTVALLVFVLPRFATIYQSRGAALPGPTRVLIGVSNGLMNYWYLWGIVLTAVVAGFWFVLRSDRGQRWLDWAKIKTPVVGRLFTRLYLTRASCTMGTMLQAGVPMLDMVSIVREVTQNKLFEDLWDTVDDRLRKGSQLSEPLYASALIPRSVAQMIHSGEKSGRLGKVMNRIAEYTEAEFDDAIKTATQFIEPVMFLVVGSIIGFVAIALLMPIFSVGKVVSG